MMRVMRKIKKFPRKITTTPQKFLEKYARIRAKLRQVDLHRLATTYEHLLPETSDKSAKIAVLTCSKFVRTSDDSRFEIYSIDTLLSKSRRHTELTTFGPFDLIIDMGTANNRHITLLNTFYHLKPNGAYVIPGGGRELALSNPYVNARKYLGDILDLQSKELPRHINVAVEKNHTKRYQLGLAWGISTIRKTGDDLTFIRNGAKSIRIKLREYEMDRLQERERFKNYTTINTIDPQPFEHKATYRLYGHNIQHRTRPTKIEQNTLSLRKYKNVIVAPRQVIADDHILLPDTYRLNSRAHLVNNGLDDINPRAATLRFSADKLPTKKKGVYFHLDDEHRGHFGHLLTETISRIWGWPIVKELYPDAKVLLCLSKEFSYIPEYEYQFYEAAGIPREDIVLLEQPTVIGTLYSAAPLFSNPNYIHPAIMDAWRLVGDNLANSVRKKKKYSKRIFCSRKQSRRSCNNGEEIEALFRDNGFDIVYPEDHSLGEQVQMFRHAEVVAGYAGSSVFTVIFTQGPKHVIILRPDTYAAENEFLISSLVGGTLDIIISKADDPNSNESPFTVDFENEGADLVRILKQLG